ncbi:MAG: hypothetical protein LCH30_02075 [Proteobacteria bacterium]|nr:hypothetical protein [Pseudomonadota bacterium]
MPNDTPESVVTLEAKRSALRKIFDELTREYDKAQKDHNESINKFFVTKADHYESEKKYKLLENMQKELRFAIKPAIGIEVKEAIDVMDENKCNEILSDFLQKINTIVESQAKGQISINEDGTENKKQTLKNYDERLMEDGVKKRFLQTHSISHDYKWSFIGKIVKLIQDALGTKTSSEKMLESFEKERKNLKIQLKEVKDSKTEQEVEEVNDLSSTSPH